MSSSVFEWNSLFEPDVDLLGGAVGLKSSPRPGCDEVDGVCSFERRKRRSSARSHRSAQHQSHSGVTTNTCGFFLTCKEQQKFRKVYNWSVNEETQSLNEFYFVQHF